MRRINGTVVVSSVAMAGGSAGWGIPISGSTLSVTLGAVVPRPVLLAGTLENHEHLCLTISVDHEIVDGAPAARFVRRFLRLLESGHGLPPLEG